MNKDEIKEWTAALRSGEYPQGTGHLLSNDGKYCCLGVLATLKHTPVRDELLFDCKVFDFADSSNVAWVPDEWMPRETQVVLAGMNDKGKTFSEIADYIESTML